MTQILHIFKKDIRRHWPEIAISLALLALYARGELHPWHELPGPNIAFFLDTLWERFASPALVIFWGFMIVRLIQSEPLVGDRQWWTTKPYIWWQLLFAKLLFIFVFICVPLFHVQIFVLHYFEFPVLANLPALVLRQLSLLIFLVVTVGLLACLTRTLSQFFLFFALVVAATIAVPLVGSALAGRGTTLTQWEDTPAFIESLSEFLTLASVAGVVVWQFARRKPRISVAALVLLVPGATSIKTIFTPMNSVDRHYPLIGAASAPINAIPIPGPHSAFDSQESGDDPYAQLVIPVTLSGLASGTELELDGLKLYATSPQNSQWSPGWLYQRRGAFQPEDREAALSYTLERKNYETVRDQVLDLRIEMAFSEYHVADSRLFRVPSSSFLDSTLGRCRIESFGPAKDFTLARCLYPLNSPGFVARFDPKNPACPQYEGDQSAPMDRVAYAEHTETKVHFPNPELSPISAYTLSFREVAAAGPVPEKLDKPRQVRLCPGTELLVSRRVFVRKFRLRLDLPRTRLGDLEARARLVLRSR